MINVKNFKWLEYGLAAGGFPDLLFNENDPHDQVCRYLDKHPELQKPFKCREVGFSYFDILTLVEKEIGRRLTRGPNE